METIIEKYAGERGSLIAVLQEVQELLGWLSPETLDYIAEKTNTPKSKVMGTVTFYAGFRLTKPAKHTIRLCQGTACHVNGSAEIEASVRGYLSKSPDNLYDFENIACLGCCSLSPVMTVDGGTYGNLTSDKALGIIKEFE